MMNTSDWGFKGVLCQWFSTEALLTYSMNNQYHQWFFFKTRITHYSNNNKKNLRYSANWHGHRLQLTYELIQLIYWRCIGIWGPVKTQCWNSCFLSERCKDRIKLNIAAYPTWHFTVWHTRTSILTLWDKKKYKNKSLTALCLYI